MKTMTIMRTALRIPWKMIEPHEDQAQRNHGQSLDRLNERGGLSSCEALAIIQDRQWKRMNPEDAYQYLESLVNQFNQKEVSRE